MSLKKEESYEEQQLDVSPAQQQALKSRVLRKMDIRVIPTLFWLFCFSFLDRTSIGNSKLLGLLKDLKLSGDEYGNCLAIYFLFYILSEVPATLVMKKLGAKFWLPFLTVAWGLVTTCMGSTQDYHGFLAVRAMLGFTEGGLLPCLVLLLANLYPRDDMVFRLSIAYVSNPMSGAFGGLLATGLNTLAGVNGNSGWRFIFWIEGAMTVVVGVVAYFLLFNDLETAPFFTEEERAFALAQMAADKPPNSQEHDQFSWTRVIQGLLSMQLFLSSTAYFCILCALYSFGLFVPTIIKGIGYSAIEAQLYSVPPYVVASVVTLFVAYYSDRMKMRGPFILACLPISIAGYALISTTNDPKTKYGALFLMAMGLYSSVPPILSWLSQNTLPHYKRATVAGMQLAVANCSGFVASLTLYPAQDGPNYVRGHRIVLGLLIAAWCLIGLNILYIQRENREKAAGRREQYRGCGDDRDPDFKYLV